MYERFSPDLESVTVLEQHIFQIVFTIPVPIRDRKKIRFPLLDGDTLDIFLPSIDELPYCDHSFFTMLLEYVSPDNLIEIFTNMLFEQKTLLICPTHDMLMPIATALHSLIYPFQMCIFNPCLINDNEDFEYSSLNQISVPINYFIGIAN